MVAFGHSAVGAIVGASVAVASAPTTAWWAKVLMVIVLGVFSHYLFDLIPHGHYDINFKHLRKDKNFWIFLADTIGASIILLLVAYATVGFTLGLLLVIVGIGAASAPDIWEASVERGIIPKSGFTKLHKKFHTNFLHWHNQPHSHLSGHARPWSITDVWQVTVFIVALLLLATLPKP